MPVSPHLIASTPLPPDAPKLPPGVFGGVSPMRIRPFNDVDDWAEWLRMSQALFPGEGPEEHEGQMRVFLERGDATVFIAERDDGSPCGFVEVGARSIADGCSTSPVSYVEAWYVDPD